MQSVPPQPLPFQFSSSQQRDIHRRLLHIGEGPAGFFRDACWLMADEQNQVQSTTHLVAHLLREIESAVRAVMVTLADQAANRAADLEPSSTKKGKADKDGHRASILKVLVYCGIAETDSVAQAWLGLTGEDNPDGLARRTHRDALARPRPLNDEFRQQWITMLSIFAAVLARFEATYVNAVEIADELLATPTPTRRDAVRLRQAVPNSPIILGHFFDHCQDPAWLEHLYREDFFRYPPEAQRDGETGQIVGYPAWPASRFLIRMSMVPEAQEFVEPIVRGLMNTKNPWVRRDIAEILTHLPLDRIVDLVPKAGDWMVDEEVR